MKKKGFFERLCQAGMSSCSKCFQECCRVQISICVGENTERDTVRERKVCIFFFFSLVVCVKMSVENLPPALTNRKVARLGACVFVWNAVRWWGHSLVKAAGVAFLKSELRASSPVCFIPLPRPSAARPRRRRLRALPFTRAGWRFEARSLEEGGQGLREAAEVGNLPERRRRGERHQPTCGERWKCSVACLPLLFVVWTREAAAWMRSSRPSCREWIIQAAECVWLTWREACELTRPKCLASSSRHSQMLWDDFFSYFFKLCSVNVAMAVSEILRLMCWVSEERKKW